MSQHLKLLSQLRKCFKEDSISLFYHGDFDDVITDKMIALISQEGAKKIRGNLAFSIAESFQNVVRHKNSFLGDGNENVFGLRGRRDYMHIFSSNLIVEEVKQILIDKIEEVNAKDKQELKELYMHILETGEINEKGGAGMGLVEMTRRSGNPLQYEFHEVDQDVYSFNLQIDFTRKRGIDPTSEPLNIEENSIVNELVVDHSILFIYKGEFGEEIVNSFMPMLECCSSEGHVIPDKVFKAVTGLIQNINEYGMPNAEGKKRGLFALKRVKEGYYVCSGNYTTENVDSLEKIVQDLNYADDEMLESIHQRVSNEVDNSDRIGLLDLRRFCAEHLELKVTEDARGTYAMLGAVITDN
ncbi:MAG: hypothetical protein HUJ25_16660 [Crocinitomicaceae bacterium]|nr:hypothetical protein [Crocinitomicaceae bacterium]